MILIRENPLFRPLERVDPENLLFWAQKALASLVAISGPKKVLISRLTPSNVAIWAQKSLDFTAHPFQWPSKFIFPHQNHDVLHHINNRYFQWKLSVG
jgi:hypothetical protein